MKINIMNKLVVPVFLDVDLETYIIVSDKTTEATIYIVNAITDFVDVHDKVRGTEINSGGIIYVSPLSKEEIERKLYYNEQDL